MVVDDLNMNPSYRLARIMNILESQYGITIAFDEASSLAELHELHESLSSESIGCINESLSDSNSSVILIKEAIAIFLSEVAPKRIKRNKKTSS